jgi:branched-chain amino acid transport system ATP-binding protein
MSFNMLEIQDLNKRFGNVVVAQSLSFEVKKGEAFGIVGPNGAGKSTLLNLVNGNEIQDSGNIVFNGVNLNNLKSSQRSSLGIARTFQIPRPFSEMSVFENVLVATNFNTKKDSAKNRQLQAIDSIERTGLGEYFNTPAGKLRLLDRKRLELSRAVASNPQLILLDEIAGGLTDSELPVLLNIIRQLKSDGVTIIWIEHIVHALVSVVDRLMCIAGGSVIDIGDPQKVLQSPKVIELYLGDDFQIGSAS